MPQYDVFDMFKGALGESTRKTRRALLGSGFFGSVMVWGQLIPKELYGMNFQDTPTQLLVPVVAVVMYFLVTFIMYSVPELVGWVTLYRRWTTGAGDHILIQDSAYQPVRNLSNMILSRYGVEITYFDSALGADVA